MRKLYIIILLVVGSFTALAQQPNGPGWKPQNTKAYQTDSSFFEKDANFNSSVRIKEGNLQIESIPVLPDATEFNILNGALVNTEEINRLVGVTSSIQTQLNARGRVATITTNILAGEETDVTLTGVTAEPYSLYIIDADGLNITDAVKDSTAISGGVYHTYIYSVDAKTNVKIRVLW